MENKEILRILRQVKLGLMAHPHNEPNSEFADHISSLEELEQAFGLGSVSKRSELLRFMEFAIDLPEIPEHSTKELIVDKYLKHSC